MSSEGLNNRESSISPIIRYLIPQLFCTLSFLFLLFSIMVLYMYAGGFLYNITIMVYLVTYSFRYGFFVFIQNMEREIVHI